MLSVGAAVLHEIYGRGTVTACATETVEVEFANGRRRRFVQDYVAEKLREIAPALAATAAPVSAPKLARSQPKRPRRPRRQRRPSMALGHLAADAAARRGVVRRLLPLLLRLPLSRIRLLYRVADSWTAGA